MTDSSPAAASSLLVVPYVSDPTDLWAKAVQKLSDEDKKDIDFTGTDKLGILGDVLAAVEKGKENCIRKRWKYKKGGHEVIIRDKLEKIVIWVNKFREVGDTVVQYDPGHAALPWAGVRLLLQVTINDSQIYGGMIDGVENVSNLITQYSIIEQVYYENLKKTESASCEQFEASLVKLYSAILAYLAQARRYYTKNTSVWQERSLAR